MKSQFFTCRLAWTKFALVKFSHGVWRMRDGVQPYWAARVARHFSERGELVLHAVHKLDPKNNLNNYGLTLRLSTPAPGVLRLRVTHLAGKRRSGPFFEVAPDRAEGARTTERSSTTSVARARGSSAALSRSSSWSTAASSRRLARTSWAPCTCRASAPT